MLKLLILKADTQGELVEYFDQVIEDLELQDTYMKFGNFHRDKGIYFYSFIYNCNEKEAQQVDEYFKNAYENMKANYAATSKRKFKKEQGMIKVIKKPSGYKKRWDVK